MNTQQINEEWANKEVKKKIARFANEKDKQNRLIDVKMLTLGKLLYGEYKGKKTTLGAFIEVLALAPNSVLNTELVSTLIDYFYEENFRNIMIYCFAPFATYFLSTICFISYFMMR